MNFDMLFVCMIYTSTQVEICPLEMYWSKVFASMDKHSCHPARPLVAIASVKGSAGSKRFSTWAATLIHLPADQC